MRCRVLQTRRTESLRMIQKSAMSCHNIELSWVVLLLCVAPWCAWRDCCFDQWLHSTFLSLSSFLHPPVLDLYPAFNSIQLNSIAGFVPHPWCPSVSFLFNTLHRTALCLSEMHCIVMCYMPHCCALYNSYCTVRPLHFVHVSLDSTEISAT